MRSFTNRGLKWTTAVFLFVYAVVFVLGSRQQQLLLYLSVINALTSLLAIACFVWNNWRVLQGSGTDRRETVFLLVEGLFAAGAFCTLFIVPAHAWLAMVQWLVFSLHSLLLLLFLIFLFTFRIKKLF